MPTIDERQELAKKADLATKQNILTPGTGITIVNDVISSTSGSTVTVSTADLPSPVTQIGSITVDGDIKTLFAPTPPTISVTQTQLSGDELATITVNGTPFTIYAPEGTVVLSGTSAPTSAQGENGDLYVQYTVTSGVYTVDMTYVKLSGEWIELAASGSEVEANPQGAATDTLNKIDIDGTIYSIGGGGEILETIFIGSASTNAWASPLVFDGFDLSDYITLYITGFYQGSSREWEIIVNNIPTCDASGNGAIQLEGEVYYGRIDDTFYMFVSTGYRLTITKIQGLRQSGGGGNVDDVYVNGTSVLDSDKIAQITSYKEVTQAEYDALPASKLTDNVLYCIKDQATADTTVAPVIYSEEEREVGVWYNGKPVYQRTFTGVTPAVNIVLLPNTTDVETIISYSGNINNSGNQWGVPYRDTSDYISIYKSNNGGLYLSYTTFFRNMDYEVTIQYTKSTDTPGSGKWAPSGVPAVHYSENEQVVGTWIDGDTLYEKTLSFTTGIANTYFQISHNIQNAKDVWIESGYVKGSTEILTLAPYRSGNDNDVFVGLISRTNESFDYKVGSEGANCPAYVTLRYTKQTN